MVIEELIFWIKERHLGASCTKFCTGPQGPIPTEWSKFGVDRPFQTKDMTSLPVNSVFHKRFLSYNCDIFCRIKISSTNFVELGPEIIRAKFRGDGTCGFGGDDFGWSFSFRDVARKKFRRKWAWPIPGDSARSPERVDIRFLIYAFVYERSKPKRVDLAYSAP